MAVDLEGAARFLAAHGRVLDRRRFAPLVSHSFADGALGALSGYRNADGGYGWGLEPDLRSGSSQPSAAMHAFEVLDEVGAAGEAAAVDLADWLARVSFADGGVAFALPVPDPSACAPFWAEADHTTSSLHITAAVTAVAHRAARSAPKLAAHPWLRAATDYCLDAIDALDGPPTALVLSYAIQFLDAAAPVEPRAVEALDRLGKFLPTDGKVHVEGGLDDEFLHPLDFSPAPDLPSRALLAPDAVAADLDQVESQQEEDGGWKVNFASYSPAAELEWRGYRTVWAVRTLGLNGRLG